MEEETKRRRSHTTLECCRAEQAFGNRLHDALRRHTRLQSPEHAGISDVEGPCHKSADQCEHPSAGSTVNAIGLHREEGTGKGPHVALAQRENQRHPSATAAGITTTDGIALRAWYVRPPKANGRDVLMLHGVGDNREGVAGFAAMFLDRGYAVLLPDSRAHGESGGTLATYGLRESSDIRRWVDWLYVRRQSKCVYGFGESMGAALVLDSLTVEDRFCAIVAESPFSTFRSVAYERAALYVRAPTWVGRTLLRLPVEVGMHYAKLRYSLDFDHDSPADAVVHSSTPVL